MTNTPRENDRGEDWPDQGIYLTFNVKKLFSYLRGKMKRLIELIYVVALFVCTPLYVFSQSQYCGYNAGLVAKQDLSNLALYSEQFDNAAWTKDSARHVITANSINAPDGSATADLATLSAFGPSTSRFIYPTTAITVVDGSTYRQATYLKQGTHKYIHFFGQTPGTAFVDVDLDSCTALRYGSTTLSYDTTSLDDDWCYVEFTYVQSGTTAYLSYQPLGSSILLSGDGWTSAGTETYYLWGASLKLASAPADYIATTSSAASLTGVCPSGYAQSPTNPSKCFSVTLQSNVIKPHEIRTEEQIAAGSE